MNENNETKKATFNWPGKLTPPHFDEDGDSVSRADEIIKWARNNLPEVHRISHYCRREGLGPQSELMLIAAMLVRSRCIWSNQAIESAMLRAGNQPIFIPEKWSGA